MNYAGHAWTSMMQIQKYILLDAGCFRGLAFILSRFWFMLINSKFFATELFTILFAVDSYFCTSENDQDDIHIVGKEITSDWMIKGE